MQIVVFIAQTWTTGQQMLQAQTLNAQTGSLLVEIRAHAAGTQALLGDQMKTVLNHACRQARTVEKTEGTPGALQDVERIVRAAVDETINRQLVTTAGTFGNQPLSMFPSPSIGSSHAASAARGEATEEDLQILDRLTTYPSEEEGRDLIAKLSSLSPLAAASLRQFVDDERASREWGMDPGLKMRSMEVGGSPFSDELLEAGLIEQVPGEDGQEWRALTDVGREVGRLLIGRAPMPDWLRDEARAR